MLIALPDILRSADSLAKKYRKAILTLEQNNEQLQGLEERLASNPNVPLSQWKAQEEQFLQDVISKDVDRKGTKSPYAAESDKGNSNDLHFKEAKLIDLNISAKSTGSDSLPPSATVLRRTQ